jgi:hypothetical protein
MVVSVRYPSVLLGSARISCSLSLDSIHADPEALTLTIWAGSSGHRTRHKISTFSRKCGPCSKRKILSLSESGLKLISKWETP